MITCDNCGMSFPLGTDGDSTVPKCISCASVPVARNVLRVHGGPQRQLASDVTRYRLAIEEAHGALFLGKYKEALAALDRVRARGPRHG